MSSDLQDTITELRDWLATRMPEARNLQLVDAFEPAQGYSSRTILFNANWEENGESRQRGLVARIQRDVSCPLLADIFHQYHVMMVASQAQDGLVPAPLFAQRDPATLGAPFYIMDRVHGRVPSDFPSYHAEGWVADLPLEDRARVWWNGVAAMERLHRIDWSAFTSLNGGLSSPPDARFYIQSFIIPWYEWAADGRTFSTIEAGIEELMRLAPPVTRSGLVWNDARMGNTMFSENGEVSALFDFEVATLGPAQVDVAGWLYIDEVFSEGFGVPHLPGIPQGEDARRGFERIYGYAMPDFSYYMALAALKHAVISIRDYGNDKREVKAENHAPFAIERMHKYLEEFRKN